MIVQEQCSGKLQSWICLCAIPSLVAILLLLCGCTIIPEKVDRHEISFDGNMQNAGFIGFSDDGQGIISNQARERFNALAALYGQRFLPALHEGDGISVAPSVNERAAYYITKDSLRKFQTMTRWRREENKKK